MTNQTIRNLPDCKLIQELQKKAKTRRDVDFKFLAVLDDFRDHVSKEISYINLLFPEYTPHDEKYHIKNLFNIATEIMGEDLLEKLNSTELLILAIGLYGHDWGMAVSENEREYILTGKLPKGVEQENLWILPGEERRIKDFAKQHMIKPDSKTKYRDMPIELWRDYVRQTHAIRSSERVRRYFKKIDEGIGDAAARACEGHWLDFEELQDYKRYPPDYSVLKETVNLRAIAVYVRLIDLLDLADDRTPYVIWKFVAPRDSKSKMEWEKHRSLRPITCSPYLEGRMIQVDGSTDDHEVYAALEDLRIQCEEQLRGCCDLLARMNDSRHTFDIFHINWRVAARGFEPILIQFEFDREQMFHILGGEIYEGDPYVFLRELLQNSIDAIRLRKEVLERNGVNPAGIGEIFVEVIQRENGDATITWKDDGVGMDDFIIRNYLAKAGKSYYQSKEFEREEFKIDPISLFGIGILSCFMVSNQVEINTFKDPYFPPESKPLKIIVPDMKRQFRIETGVREGAIVGTTIKVYIEGNKRLRMFNN